jgi:hypothetical protein
MHLAAAAPNQAACIMNASDAVAGIRGSSPCQPGGRAGSLIPIHARRGSVLTQADAPSQAASGLPAEPLACSSEACQCAAIVPGPRRVMTAPGGRGLKISYRVLRAGQ